MITCAECPRCKDLYPDKVDSFGNHFQVCGMSGNMVRPEPRREKKINGNGYIYYKPTSCWLYDTVEDALKHMSKLEIERWKAEKNKSTQSEKGTVQENG